MRHVANTNLHLGLVIDLTNTTRYYDPKVTDANILGSSISPGCHDKGVKSSEHDFTGIRKRWCSVQENIY